MVKITHKLSKKLTSTLRRIRLGDRFKHQYHCHPHFNLIRCDGYCELWWHGKKITHIPFAYTLSQQANGPCFIVASGPSLAEVDLHSFRSYSTLSLNCAIKKFADAGLHPTHAIIVDHRVFEGNWACVVETIRSGAHCFFSYDGLSIIAERSPDLFALGNIYLIESVSRKFGIARRTVDESRVFFAQSADIWLDPTLSEYCRSIGFSTDLKLGVFSGKTVATWAVQLAYGLGFNPIFIVGMDLGGTGKAHFYADTHNPSPDFLAYYEPHIRACFELARAACQKNGVGLYNLSLHSALPDQIVPKMRLHDALQLLRQPNQPV